VSFPSCSIPETVSFLGSAKRFTSLHRSSAMHGCVYPSFEDGCYGLFANLTNKTWCKKDHGLGTMRNNEIDSDIDNS
jgi:hypothetical protein